ncbi:MAG TPA: GrpB family protein [Candidatus Bathyarchaeia archaeon]|nr:GrpB family protein [Candidatus Bathyarchaeia archaeon]
MTVTLVQPYDPAWPAWFQQIKTFLESGLVDVACTIEHVGGTSIPGMVAKPIIDLDIVTPPGAFPTIKAQMETLGYVHLGDLGLPGREAFDLADAETRGRLPEHHLYVCEDGSYELRKHLAFRDFMRQHPEWRDRLNRLKQDLCIQHNNDRQAYIDGKADMVEKITQLAMENSE